MRRHLLAALLLVLVGSASCYDPRVRARLGCGPNGECPGDLRCVDDVCGGQPLDAGTPDADLGPYELTVLRVGPSPGGVATVNSVTAGIACGTECVHSYDAGTQVTLRVTLENGSGLRFAGWRGACAGIDTECRLSMDGDREVTAEFAAITHNLAFVTRTSYNLRVLDQGAFDNDCNLSASTAGINNATRDGFSAWVSDEFEGAREDLVAASGWVRMDGLPFSATLTGLTSGHILNPLTIDEGGRDVVALVVTGTDGDGSAASHCSSWTGNGPVTMGRSTGGPTSWTSSAAPDCDTLLRAPVYCLQRTLRAAMVLAPRPSGARRLFITRGSFSPGPGGLTGADALCASESPTGSSVPFKALLARNGQPAGTLLDPAMNYYSMSDQLIGSGRELLDGVRLHTGIWQHGDGGFLSDATVAGRQVRTGSARPSETSQDCGGWTQTTGTTAVGLATDSATWWALPFGEPCATAMRIYCVEQ